MMTQEKHEGAPGAESSDVGATGAPARERRMTARRKQGAVLRVLRGEPLETLARELRVTVAELSGWRDAFLEAGSASLKSRPRDDRDDRIAQLQAKLGAVTMDNELLYEKVARLEDGRPLGRRGSRR
jgi:transposase